MHATPAINANSSAPKNALESSTDAPIKLAAKKPATALSTIIITEAAVLFITDPPKKSFCDFYKAFICLYPLVGVLGFIGFKLFACGNGSASFVY